MESQNNLLKILETQLKKLNEIRDSIENTTQRFHRWSDNTFKIIETHLGSEEAENFDQCLNNVDVHTRLSNCYSYLEVLIEEIRENPESFKKSLTNNSAINLLNNMHEEVTKIAKDKIENKDYRGAVLDVCIALEGYTKKKSKKFNYGANLMEEVFSEKNPTITISNEKEEQRGYMFLFSGAMKAIRNRYVHDSNKADSLQETLEILGFLSFLFKAIDKNSI